MIGSIYIHIIKRAENYNSLYSIKTDPDGNSSYDINSIFAIIANANVNVDDNIMRICFNFSLRGSCKTL